MCNVRVKHCFSSLLDTYTNNVYAKKNRRSNMFGMDKPKENRKKTIQQCKNSQINISNQLYTIYHTNYVPKKSLPSYEEYKFYTTLHSNLQMKYVCIHENVKTFITDYPQIYEKHNIRTTAYMQLLPQMYSNDTINTL